MNISEVVSVLKSQLGLYDIVLPFKDKNGFPVPTENIIQSVLGKATVKEFSEFVPWMRIGDCHVDNLKVVDRRNGIYMLPVFLTITPIKYVSDVSLPMVNTRGTYGDVSPAYGISRTVQGVITSQEYMMLAGQMRAEPTFEYLGFNKIKLYGYPRTMLTFKVACEHEPNLETIDEGCYDSFMELATLDLKVFLYNNLKRYKSIPSAHGNASIEIDDWSNAESDRTQLLERWRDTYHVDQIDWIEFL